MKTIFGPYPLFCIFLVLIFTATVPAKAQEVPKVTFEELQATYQKDNDTLYVVNFWATWCKPCVEEMPYFEKINQEYREKPLKIIFVSLDFSSNYEDRVIPFVKKKALQSEVVFLKQPSGQEWISEVHESWSGAIPATLFTKGNGEKQEFREQSFEYEGLKKVIDQQL